MEKISLRLIDFKCHKDTSIELNTLTLLTGANASGKSSIIQSLLLVNSASLSSSKDNDVCDVLLKDVTRSLDLGSVDNLINMYGRDEAHIVVSDEDFYFTGYEEVQDSHLLMHMPVNRVLALDEITYICAEREGPRSESIIDEARKKDCGCHGEFVATVINNNQFTKVDDSRLYSIETEPNFRIQLDAWSNYLFPGMCVRVQALSMAKCRVTINNDILHVTNVATNVGFGVSYALPIIVSCLLARKGELLIVENPEAHLHAKAQSNMGYFLGVMAASGLRIIVETHSEHIVNGIRRAIVDDSKLTSEDVSLYFFEQAADGVKQTCIEVDEQGNLSKFPVDFFDQQRQDSKWIYEQTILGLKQN